MFKLMRMARRWDARWWAWRAGRARARALARGDLWAAHAMRVTQQAALALAAGDEAAGLALLQELEGGRWRP